MTHQRTRIRDHVESHPGVHFNELVRGLDLAPGQVQYHVRKLRRSEALVEHGLYGRTHYYAPEYGPWERATIALLRRETARDVVVSLLDHGSASPATVTEELGIARSTLEWHLDHLTEQGVVAKRHGAGNRVTLSLRRPRATAHLLEAVAPSLPERMVDRFTRLVDSVLDGG